MKAVRALLLILVLILMAPFVIVSGLAQQRKEERKRRTSDESDESVARAEKRLGRTLPEPLRAFYLSGRHKKRAPEGEWFGLDGAVKEYRMLTRKPYGPEGQDWPADLFPLADLLHGYAGYEFATGEIVEWDPDEIVGGDESDAAWERSFTRTGKTLVQWAR